MSDAVPAPDGPGLSRDPRIRPLDDPVVALLFDLVVDLDVPVDFGMTPSGRRILYRATGGSFAGALLHGTVVGGGGDWATFHRGRMSLDVRLTLRTHDDALIYMTYGGRWITPPELRSEMIDPAARVLIDPARYYFRTTPSFETGSSAYAWLNDLVCVGAGYAITGGVGYRIHRVQ